MNSKTNNLTAVCGLNCRVCELYIMSTKELQHMEIPLIRGNINEKSCNGCRAQSRCLQCEECKVFDCAWEKGYEQCNECPDNPCAELKLLRQEKGSQQSTVNNTI